jgi:hypothetical protein
VGNDSVNNRGTIRHRLWSLLQCLSVGKQTKHSFRHFSKNAKLAWIPVGFLQRIEFTVSVTELQFDSMAKVKIV